MLSSSLWVLKLSDPIAIAGWVVALVAGGVAAWAFSRASALETTLRQLQASHDELQGKVTKAIEDRDTTVKRVQREAARSLRFGSEPVIKALLPVLDNLERAIEASDEDQPDGILDGVRMISDQFVHELKRHGVTPIDARGQDFDPREHEAVQEAPSAEHPQGTVIAQWQRGYRFHDRLIRPARVVVSSGPDPDEEVTDPAIGRDDDVSDIIEIRNEESMLVEMPAVEDVDDAEGEE